MRFMRFSSLVVVVYIALAYARRFSAGCDGACSPQGLEYAFLVSLQVLVAAVMVALGTALVRRAPSPPTQWARSQGYRQQARAGAELRNDGRGGRVRV
jgi:hypothetical protein